MLIEIKTISSYLFNDINENSDSQEYQIKPTKNPTTQHTPYTVLTATHFNYINNDSQALQKKIKSDDI